MTPALCTPPRTRGRIALGIRSLEASQLRSALHRKAAVSRAAPLPCDREIIRRVNRTTEGAEGIANHSSPSRFSVPVLINVVAVGNETSPRPFEQRPEA